MLLQVLGSALFVVLLSARRTWQTALLNALWAAVVLALAPRVIASGGAHALAVAYLWTYGPVLLVLSLLVVRALRMAGTRAVGGLELPRGGSVVAVR